uniref:Putative secreted protein n=1 Tax=Ixodes ricinus TaxID=34613 RepID=A0A6B0UCA9_IXORI
MSTCVVLFVSGFFSRTHLQHAPWCSSKFARATFDKSQFRVHDLEQVPTLQDSARNCVVPYVYQRFVPASVELPTFGRLQIANKTRQHF